jgi:hypothetical protein
MADEHNRLGSKFSVVGAFWAPEAIDTVQTGTLRADENGVAFTTSPEYKRGRKELPSPSAVLFGGKRERLPVLHGFTEHGPCTLCDLDELDRPGLTDHSLGQSVRATAYRVSACLTGMHVGGSSDGCLSSARYTFSGLSDWLPKATSETWDKEYITLKIPLESRDILDFCVREGRLQVTIKAFPQLTSDLADGARISKSVVFVEVESPLPESLIWYYQIGNRLENLFSLLTGTSLALETLFVYRGEESGHVNSRRSNHVRPFDPRECVWCTPAQLANAIAIWLGETREFRRVESLALGVVRKGKLFIETEFLSLAQALEGVHRVTEHIAVGDRAVFRQVRRKIIALLKQEDVAPALSKRICDSISHANDPAFASRLTALCQRVSGPLLQRMGIEPIQFVADVVATRNFYTHAGSKSPQRGILDPGLELFLLNQRMRSLLRGALLLHLGLPEDQVEKVLVREATRYH